MIAWRNACQCIFWCYAMCYWIMLTNRNVHIGQHVKLLLLNSALLWYLLPTLRACMEGDFMWLAAVFTAEVTAWVWLPLCVFTKRRNCHLLWLAEVVPNQCLVLFFRSSSLITGYCFPLSISGQKRSEYFFYILVINRKDLSGIWVLPLLLASLFSSLYCFFSDFLITFTCHNVYVFI